MLSTENAHKSVKVPIDIEGGPSSLNPTLVVGVSLAGSWAGKIIKRLDRQQTTPSGHSCKDVRRCRVVDVGDYGLRPDHYRRNCR
jgi:hypothetical protein